VKRRIKAEPLSLDAFAPFGKFANLINPVTDKLGEKPVEFFRDMLQLKVSSSGSLSYSTCRVEPRPFIVDVLEYHTDCAEGILPLDNDILVQVAPATHPNDPVPVDKLRAFYVPKGTIVTINPGVWHWGPFSVNNQPANILINLPERTYANDCIVVDLDGADKVEIEL
jgi:ureidoglycolate lyase